MNEVRLVRAGDLSPDTAQTPGMTRISAIDSNTAGSDSLWVGIVTVAPGARSGAHHHGDCDSAIYVTAGRIRVRFGERLESSVDAGPGDFLFIPARLVHQEINLDDDHGIDSIVVRNGPNTVVNVELPVEDR